MPRFAPPGVLQRTGVAHSFFGRVRLTRGVTIIKCGGHYMQVDPSVDDRVDAAETIYLGGHEYEITHGEAESLAAAGYGDWVSHV